MNVRYRIVQVDLWLRMLLLKKRRQQARLLRFLARKLTAWANRLDPPEPVIRNRYPIRDRGAYWFVR